MILQNTKELTYTPKRIVSLVPSQTELLHYLQLEKETIGITKFCLYPSKWFTTKTRVGGTKTINLKKIKELKPDLIIANKEENVQEQIEELAADFPIWVTDVNNLDDALLMINNIGELTSKSAEAQSLICQIQTSFDALKPLSAPLKTAYLIWQKPYMTIGGDTFIHDMLTRCGLQSIFADQLRYPRLEISDLPTANCHLLLLSSEPYPFKEKHIKELSAQLPNTKIILVDGEMFSWYGSRLLKSATYFKKLISEL